MSGIRECRQTMFNWAERMHRRAVTLSSVVTSCGHLFTPYPRRLEKVKFGIPIEEVCKNDIPGLLLVLILKLNKEGLYKKDIFRAPGHQGNIKKLVYFLQVGRLVNMDRFSVYTIASVLKKFLSKVPGGIFGRQGEQELFRIIDLEDITEQRVSIRSLIATLPQCTQRLLVLIFGTLRVIASNCDTYQTGMTSEALGVSVAPSFFHTCVSDGREATMNDVMRFKADVTVATQIMKFMIDNFGVTNLFGRDNYEYYARITGRVVKVEEEWIFSVRYPPDRFVALCKDMRALKDQGDARSCLALINISEVEKANACGDNLNAAEGSNLAETSARLSISLEENGLYRGFEKCKRRETDTSDNVNLDEFGAVNRSAKSLSYLPEVHERQVARMRTRSEWFLTPAASPGQAARVEVSCPPTMVHLRAPAQQPSADAIGGTETKTETEMEAGAGTKAGAGLSASAESVQKHRSSLRRLYSRQLFHTLGWKKKSEESKGKTPKDSSEKAKKSKK